ncbi:MAG: cytochrome c oxidase subunit II [Sorangiineae bacterium NIC37A_2]|nr:MAG: cytochrome c oxidase subunit II [Sorangiineae bacterium NIC37A_2]
MISNLLASTATDASLPKSPPSNDTWMPIDASTFASHVDGLYDFLFWLSVVAALSIYGVMFYFIVKYRAKSREASEVGDDVSHHNTALEITWSVIPLLFCVGIFVSGFKGYVDLRTAPREALEIHAQGQKWKWLFTYPNGHVDSELHVPVDQDVRIIIQSVDVLHSLFIPAFRTKMDAVPGRYTDLWFRATKSGEFPVFCAEYCGTSHSDMIAKAVVHEPGGYDAWMEEIVARLDNMPPVELGKLMYDQQGCKTCHSVDGSTLVGPSWQGLWGKTRTFADGSSAVVDENYIRNSINDPMSQVVQGFAPSMPTYQGKLSDKQINGIIEYIKSLK